MSATRPLISLLGDSITTFQGCNPPFYPVYYENDLLEKNGLEDVEDIWWDQVLCALNGLLLVNNSWSGSRVSGGGFPAGCSAERTHALHRGDAVPDKIFIYLGFNDFALGVTPRKEDEDELFSFFGAYCAMLRQLQAAYPHSELCCGTLLRSYLAGSAAPGFPDRLAAGYSFEEYNDRIREACARAGGRLVDMAATGIAYESLDGAHPTAVGHRELARAWLRAMGE